MYPIENLESRRLFTTAGFPDSDTLTIQANPGNDVIVLETASVPNHLAVHVNSEPVLTFPFTSKRPGHDIFRIVLRAGAGNDTVTANVGFRLTLDGEDGDDTITSSSGRIEMLGGAGNDRLTATSQNPDELMFSGQSGNDVIAAMQALTKVTAFGGSGRDLIMTGAGNDHLWGGPSSDTIIAGAGDDVVISGTGDDIVYGDDSVGSATGNDWIFGMTGNDSLFGGSGTDHLFGQSGDDVLTGGAGADTLFGGGGNDTMVTGTGDLFRGREYRRYERLLSGLVPDAPQDSFV